MIIGHLATAVLLKNHYPQEETLPLFIGSIFPDIGDKSIKYARKIYEGRTLFHSLLGFALTVAILSLFAKRSTVRSWVIGYALHLLCDTGGTVPWLYPFVRYEHAYSPYSYPQKVVRLITSPKLAETALVIWAIIDTLKPRKCDLPQKRQKQHPIGQAQNQAPIHNDNS